MPFSPKERALIDTTTGAAYRRSYYQVPDTIAAGVEHDRQIVGEDMIAVLVSRDAIRLYERMEFLCKHPRLLQLFGGSAVSIAGGHGDFETPIIQTPRLYSTCQEIFSRLYFEVAPPDFSTSRYNKILDIKGVKPDSYQDPETVPLYKVDFRINSPDTSAKVIPITQLSEDSSRFSAQIEDRSFLQSPPDREIRTAEQTYVLGVIRAATAALAANRRPKKRRTLR